MLYALELLPQCPAQLCPALPIGGPALTSGIAGLDTVVNQGTEPQPGSKTAPFRCYSIPIIRRHRRHLETPCSPVCPCQTTQGPQLPGRGKPWWWPKDTGHSWHQVSTPEIPPAVQGWATVCSGAPFQAKGCRRWHQDPEPGPSCHLLFRAAFGC